jgi:hypothetical protein
MAMAAVAEKDAEIKCLAKQAESRIQEEREKVVQEMEEQNRWREVKLANAAR